MQAINDAEDDDSGGEYDGRRMKAKDSFDSDFDEPESASIPKEDEEDDFDYEGYLKFR